MSGRTPKNFKVLMLEKGVLYGSQKKRGESIDNREENLKVPLCPKIYTKSEREIWNQYADILKEYKLFNIANGPLLELIVRNVKDRENCIKKVKEEGIIIDSYRGKIYNPYWSAKNRCEENILKCLNQLGLSSIGLTRLGCLHTKEKKSEMASLIDG